MASRQGESVFDRLYQTSTRSSASRTSAPRQQESPQRTRTSQYRPKTFTKPRASAPSAVSSSGGSVFDRLYQKSTISSASRIDHSPLSSPKSSPSRTKAAARTTKSPKKLSPVSKKTAPESVSAAVDTCDDGGTSTILPWKLTYTDKCDTAQPKTESELSFPKLRTQLGPLLQDYELGLVDETAVARALITALFDRDFTSGEHWDVDAATVKVLEGIPTTFAAEKQATWDREDVCSVASAKGTICFDREHQEICVREYSYNVAD